VKDYVWSARVTMPPSKARTSQIDGSLVTCVPPALHNAQTSDRSCCARALPGKIESDLDHRPPAVLLLTLQPFDQPNASLSHTVAPITAAVMNGFPPSCCSPAARISSVRRWPRPWPSCSMAGVLHREFVGRAGQHGRCMAAAVTLDDSASTSPATCQELSDCRPIRISNVICLTLVA